MNITTVQLRRNLLSFLPPLALVILAIITFTKIAFAAPLTIGNDANSRSTTDTYANFTIVDTNNPASANGTISSIDYYAANTNPFRFVLIDSANTVQWVSTEINPPSVGVNTYTPVSPVAVSTGWNIGMYFAQTGTIPFDFGGNPANYTANNSGQPLESNTLVLEGSSGRTYSFIAHGDTTAVSEPISEPVSPSPSSSVTPSSSPVVSASPSPSVAPSASPIASSSPSHSPSISPSPSPGIGDSASGAAILSVNSVLTFASFQAHEPFNSLLAGGSFAQSNIFGKSLVASIQCVNIVGNTAWFAGPVTATNTPSAVGKWVFGKAQDISLFGFGDKLSGNLVSPDPSCSLTTGMGTPSGIS